MIHETTSTRIDALRHYARIEESEGFFNSVAHKALALTTTTTHPAAMPAQASVVPDGFDRESLQDVLEGMETEDQTIDVGEGHIESSAGYVCRLIRTLLAAPTPPATPRTLTDADIQRIWHTVACVESEETIGQRFAFARAIELHLSGAPAAKEPIK